MVQRKSEAWSRAHWAQERAGRPVTWVSVRIVTAMVHVDDRVRFLFTATAGTPSDADHVAEEVDDVVLTEIKRGQKEGTLIQASRQDGSNE